MAWITTEDGRRVNTEWFDEDERRKYAQIEENQKQADKLNGKKENKLSFLEDNPKLQKAVDKAFDKANLMEEPDIYKALYSYKAIRDLDDDKIELLYNELAFRLFGAKY